MPGMGHPLQTNNAFILSAFHRSLFHQLLFVLLIALVVLVAWNTLRTVQYRRAVAAGGSMPSSTAYPYPEPAARRLLRISFGLIWLFDGLLQAQASMPLGLPPRSGRTTRSPPPRRPCGSRSASARRSCWHRAAGGRRQRPS
jgi:hypothetical protein